MTRLKPKQIDDNQISRMGVVNFAGVGASNVVTAEITSAASADGVSVLASSGVKASPGFSVTPGVNKSLLFDASSKEAIVDDSGNEVFGRLTQAAGIYTLSYFSIIAGVETSYVLPATPIDFYVSYNYLAKDFPYDANIRVTAVQVGEDPSGKTGRTIRNEKVTVTATNTLADIARTPLINSISLYVRGKSETEGASESFTISGKTITWIPAQAEYDLETTDDVTVHYNTLEPA